MNQLFEYGSTVDLVIRTKGELVVNGKTYAPNEVYTILRDVPVQFNYNSNSTAIAAKKPVYNGTTQYLPTSAIVSYVPLTTKLANLLFEEGTTNQQIMVREKRSATTSGEIILKRQPANSTCFVKDEFDNKVAAQLDIATKTLSNLTPGVEYQIDYYTVATGSCFGLEQKFQPYFSVELITRGNNNKSTNMLHIILPSVKIDVMPSMEFIGNGQLGISLRLNIIYQGQEQPVMVFK